jgi:hypothetical protein
MGANGARDHHLHLIPNRIDDDPCALLRLFSLTCARPHVLVMFMSPATLPVATSAPDPAMPGEDRPSRFGSLIGLVRRLIDYGKELAATLQQRAATTDLALVTLPFGTRDIGLILARIGAACAPASRHQAHIRGRSSSCPAAHVGADRRRGPPPAGRCGHRRYLPRSRHHAEPQAVAGPVPRHHPASRRPRRALQGHPRPGDAVSCPSPVQRPARRSAGAIRPDAGGVRHRPALNRRRRNGLRPQNTPMAADERICMRVHRRPLARSTNARCERLIVPAVTAGTRPAMTAGKTPPNLGRVRDPSGGKQMRPGYAAGTASRVGVAGAASSGGSIRRCW